MSDFDFKQESVFIDEMKGFLVLRQYGYNEIACPMIDHSSKTSDLMIFTKRLLKSPIIAIKNNFILFREVLHLWACRRPRRIPTSQIRMRRQPPNNRDKNHRLLAVPRLLRVLLVGCTSFVSKTDL